MLFTSQRYLFTSKNPLIKLFSTTGKFIVSNIGQKPSKFLNLLSSTIKVSFDFNNIPPHKLDHVYKAIIAALPQIQDSLPEDPMTVTMDDGTWQVAYKLQESGQITDYNNDEF